MALDDSERINGIRVYTDDTNPGVPLDGTSSLIVGTFGKMMADATSTLSRGVPTKAVKELNVLDYGADETGVADSRQAFIDAFTAINTNGGGSVYIPPGDYNIGSAIDHTFTSNVRIHGPGNIRGADTILLQGGGIDITLDGLNFLPASMSVQPALRIQSVSTGQHGTTLTTPVGCGAISFTVASGGSVPNGWLCKLASTTLWPYRPTGTESDVRGEMQILNSRTSNVCTPDHPLWMGYDSGETVNVTFRNYVRVFANDVTIDFGGPAVDDGSNNIGWENVWIKDSVIKNCFVRGCEHSGVTVASSVNVAFIGGNFVDCVDESLGYGISIGQSSQISCTGVNTRNNRRGINTAASSGVPVHGLTVTGGTHEGLENKGSTLGTHAAANHVLIDGCVIVGGRNSATIRSPNTTVQNCTIHRPRRDASDPETGGFYLLGGSGCVFQGNVQHLHADDAEQADQAGDVFLRIGEPATSPVFSGSAGAPLVIRGNTACVRRYFLKFNDDVAQPQRMIIEDNYVALESEDAADQTKFAIFDNASVTFDNCRIVNNHVEAVNGDAGTNGFVFAGNVIFDGLYMAGNSGLLESQGTSGSNSICPGWPTVMFNASAAVTITLRDGSVAGQLHTARCTGSNASTLTVLNHESGSNHVINFTANNQYATLVWTGVAWATLNTNTV